MLRSTPHLSSLRSPIVPLATGVLVLDAAAQLDAPWTGTGPGTTNLASDGTGVRPRFEYHVHADRGTWSFGAAASSARRTSVAWCYTGFHAWLNVCVEFERFVRRGEHEIFRETLAHGARSGTFAYCGTSTFDVWPGDVYGFRMSGSDFGG